MIINPMWFYWMGVFGKMQVICFIISVFAGFIGCVAFAYYVDNPDDNKDVDALKAAQRLFLIALCFLFVGIFIPSEKTMTKILIASQVNEANVERAKEVADYIIDKINEAQGE